MKKCDLKKVTDQRDELGAIQEVFLPCARERVGVFPTMFGRMGLCLPCHGLMLKSTAEIKLDMRKPKEERMVKQPIRLRRGVVVTDDLPANIAP